MNALMKGNPIKLFSESRDTLFGRTIDDILDNSFPGYFDADIREGRDSYRLEIPVPGMRSKDINIHIDDTVMLVSAQKGVKKTSWKSAEVSPKRFQRSFVLPADADTNHIKAKCRNGMLMIRIGKIKSKAHRVIKITGENSGETGGKLASWWNRLASKTRELFVRKY